MAAAILAADTLEGEGILEEEDISRAEGISEVGVILPEGILEACRADLVVTIKADFTDTSDATDTADMGIIAITAFSFPTHLSLVTNI
jgi:hypothetical protein